MKIANSAVTALVAALALGASSAQAQVLLEPVHEFEPLHFALVAGQTTNVETVVSSNTTNSTAIIKHSKITTQNLLSFLATAFNTNWPGGAQLALDNWTGHIFVVDKAGTDPLYDASVGITNGSVKTVYFSCRTDGYDVYQDDPPIRHHSPNEPSYRETRYGKIFFHLFSEQNGSAATDLSWDGLDTSELTAATNDIVIQADTAPVTGSGVFENGTATVITGEVSGSGTWYSPPVNEPLPL
jgi:hypothetical protein